MSLLTSATVSAGDEVTAAERNAIRKDVAQVGGDYATATGAGGAYAITIDAQIDSYVTGAVYKFKANHSTGAGATLAVNGMATKTILAYKNGAAASTPAAIAASDIVTDQIVVCVYDGANMIVISPLNRTITKDDTTQLPTTGQKLALAGTSGTPGTGNEYVTDDDPRVPTQSENDALAGTGTPSGSNKYVTEDTLTARAKLHAFVFPHSRAGTIAPESDSVITKKGENPTTKLYTTLRIGASNNVAHRLDRQSNSPASVSILPTTVDTEVDGGDTGSNSPLGGAYIGSYLYISYYDDTNFDRVRRFDENIANGTLMTYSGTAASGRCVSDGTDLWIADWDSTNIMKYTISGTTLTHVSTTAIGGETGAQKLGLYFDGTYFYWWIFSGGIMTMRKYDTSGSSSGSKVLDGFGTTGLAEPLQIFEFDGVPCLATSPASGSQMINVFPIQLP